MVFMDPDNRPEGEGWKETYIIRIEPGKPPRKIHVNWYKDDEPISEREKYAVYNVDGSVQPNDSYNILSKGWVPGTPLIVDSIRQSETKKPENFPKKKNNSKRDLSSKFKDRNSPRNESSVLNSQVVPVPESEAEETDNVEGNSQKRGKKHGADGSPKFKKQKTVQILDSPKKEKIRFCEELTIKHGVKVYEIASDSDDDFDVKIIAEKINNNKTSKKRKIGPKAPAIKDKPNAKAHRAMIGKNDSNVTRNRVKIGKFDSSPSQNRVLTGKHDSSASQNRMLTSGHDSSASQNRVLTSGHDSSPSQNRMLTSEHDSSQSQNRVLTSKHEWNPMHIRILSGINDPSLTEIQFSTFVERICGPGKKTEDITWDEWKKIKKAHSNMKSRNRHRRAKAKRLEQARVRNEQASYSQNDQTGNVQIGNDQNEIVQIEGDQNKEERIDNLENNGQNDGPLIGKSSKNIKKKQKRNNN